MISLVLPTYNEKDNISSLIPRLEDVIKKNKYDAEIIVVDDSSPDGTAKVAEDLGKKYGNVRVIVRKKKEGIGAAIREGYDSANGDIIMSMDVDSLDPEDIPSFVSKINDGFDLVVGSRHRKGGVYEKKAAKTRLKKVISTAGNRFIKGITGLKLSDFTLNYRAMKKEAWKAIKTERNGSDFLVEMILKIHKKGFKVGEIPVVFKDRVAGSSKIRLFHEAKNVLSLSIKLGLSRK